MQNSKVKSRINNLIIKSWRIKERASIILLSYWLAIPPAPPVLLLRATISIQLEYQYIPDALCFSLFLSLSVVALRQTPVHQNGDQGCERRAREEPAGVGADSERAHQRAQVQVRFSVNLCSQQLGLSV